MPSLRSQTKLDFPLQKDSRRRSLRKATEVEEDVRSPRKRRTHTNSENEPPVSICSPVKKTKTQRPAAGRSSTPSKSALVSVATPSKSVLVSASTPSKSSAATSETPSKSAAKTVRFADSPTERPRTPTRRPGGGRLSLPLALSPRRNFGNVPDDLTPTGSPRRLSDLMGVASPARALDFSTSPRRLSSGAQLPSSSPAAPTTPPKRGLVGLSPAKEMRMALSPSRRSFPGAVSPRKLLASPRKFDQPPMSPRKLDVRSLTSPMRLAKQEGICYQRAKQALHTALPDRIVCREKEQNVVCGFLDTHIGRRLAGSLYISGAPGTGKTAVLSHVIQDLQSRDDCHSIYINCMNFKNSQAIFNKVQSEMSRCEVVMPTKQAIKQLEKDLCAKGKPVVLILDEVDQLDSRNQDVLYTMFEWPTLQNSRLVLIGIANALDLTDRILPRLQARPNCRPQLLNFEPYTKEQIVAVLKDRLNQVSLEGHVVLDPTAVQFCARKVAAVAGDMRRALDVCRRAVEAVEAEVRRQPLIHSMSGLGVCGSPSKRPPVPKKITVAHIMRTLNEVYGGGSSMASSSAQQTIPLQQKLAICSLLLMVKHGKAKEVTLGKLHETYQKVCKKQQVAAIGQSEFHSLCSLVEAKGILTMKKAKETRMAKVTLKLDESELQQALQDKVLMSTILQNGLPK